jgi:TPR repeat protein
VDYIDWTKEPDVGQLRTLVELLAKNPAEALPGLELLAQRGSVAACSHLAYFYLEGGPAEFLDINRAKYWYLKAQERGDPETAYMLGRLHYQAHEYDSAFSSFSKEPSMVTHRPFLTLLDCTSEAKELKRTFRSTRDCWSWLPPRSTSLRNGTWPCFCFQASLD